MASQALVRDPEQQKKGNNPGGYWQPGLGKHPKFIHDYHFNIMMLHIRVFPKIAVHPNHPFFIGFSILNHPFWSTPIVGNIHIVFVKTHIEFPFCCHTDRPKKQITGEKPLPWYPPPSKSHRYRRALRCFGRCLARGKHRGTTVAATELRAGTGKIRGCCCGWRKMTTWGDHDSEFISILSLLFCVAIWWILWSLME